jgi:ABC-2 type transport system ATP-binding protein
MQDKVPVIQTNGLTKTYGDVTALNGLSLEVPKHSIYGFLGPNGSGKTTAIKLLLALARPTSGSGTILGHDIVKDSLAIRQRVGYLAQDPRFYEHLSARETLRFVARFFYAGPANLIEERVETMLRLVGLEGKADRPIRGFSGGERQRLGIAQAQINQPDLLILDEPASALDPLGRRDVLAIMERLRAETTIFYSTHILDDVQRVSDMVAILNRGELIAQAPIGELLAGRGAATYVLAVKGDVEKARARLTTQPWVTSVDGVTRSGVTRWHVYVSDEIMAERELLRQVLAVDDVTVLEFGIRKANLEETFLDIIEGGRDAA